MAGTVEVIFEPFFSLDRIAPFYPQAFKVLLEFASRTNVHFTASFHQLRSEFNRDVHEAIELHVFWEDEQFAALCCPLPLKEGLMEVRDYQFRPAIGYRHLRFRRIEEGVS